MGLKHQLKRLEQQAGINGFCPHRTEIRYYYPGEGETNAEHDTRPAPVCAVCGREQQIVQIVYVENWRGSDEDAPSA
jgi:hypothetical protein